MINLDTSNLKTVPYPYLIQKNIINNNIYQSLKNHFPGDEVFNKNRSNADYIFQGGCKGFFRSSPGFNEYLKTNDPWNELFNYINNKKFMNEVIEVLRNSLDQFNLKNKIEQWKYSNYVEPNYPNLTSRIFNKLKMNYLYDQFFKILHSKNDYYFLFEILKAENGYSREIHTDNKNKLAIMLFYFGSLEGENPGGEFVMYEPRIKKELKDFERFPDINNVKEIARITPEDNVGGLMLNCPNAYHSVTKITNTISSRKFLQVSLCSHQVLW
tara:strand:- start:3670 stop:4479 length:810 start_codon:yes stop_codon:yes gene_type:complete